MTPEQIREVAKTGSPAQLRDALRKCAWAIETQLGLLTACRSHVYRQQRAGSHEQDREDAKELYPALDEYLK